MASVQMVCHLNYFVCCCVQGHFAANNLFSIIDKAGYSAIIKIHQRYYQNRNSICNPLAVNPNFLAS